MSISSDEISEFSVPEVFIKDAPKYVIPIYQRNYTWGKDEIELLLDDIQVLEKEGAGDYYLGNLIVSIKDNKYEIIDGQQRLTTLYILCKLLGLEVPSESLTFQVREKSTETLKKLKKWNEEIITSDDDSEEILNGYRIIERYIKPEDIPNIKDYLKRVKLLRIEVPNTDLNHYFEIMNTRGEQLEAQDIIKARMMGVLKTDEDKCFFSTIWNACSDMDSYVQMNFEDTKMRTRIFGETWNEFPKKYEDLAEIIKGKQETGLKLEYILDKPGDDNKNEKKSNNELSENNSTSFKSIIEFPYFLIHINILVTGTDVTLDDKELLNMYNNKEYYGSPENVKKFIFQLLKYRFLFDKFIIKKNYEKEKEKDWSLKKMNSQGKTNYTGTFGVEKDTDDAYINKKIRTLQSALRITYTSPKTMYWITEILQDENLLTENNGKLFLDKIEHYCKKRVKEALLEFDNTKNAYRNMERIVYTYLDYILWRDGYKDFELPKDWKFLSRNSLEHFYPQNPDETQKNNEPLDPEFLHSFGNLCLVDVRANSKFSNLVPNAKIENCSDTIKQSLKLIIMAKIAETKGWGPSKPLIITNHGEEMLALLRADIDKDKKS